MSLLYHSTIRTVAFSLVNTETAKHDSYVEVSNHDLFRNGVSAPGGMYDLHMGTIDYEQKCQTCHNPKKVCLGHEGHINMRYPIINPIAAKELPKWLKLVCFRCGHPMLSRPDYMKYPRNVRLAEAYKAAKSVKDCPNCSEPHATVKRDKKQSLRFVAEYIKDGRKYNERILYPHVIKNIVNKISDEVAVDICGKNGSHPRNFILDAIKVPSVLIRPDVKKMGGGRSTNDDLTTMLQLIEKLNETMPAVVEDTVDAKIEKHIYELVGAYHDFIKGPADGTFSNLAKRLKGKQGLIRRNGLGKRVHNMARSTITGDPTLRIDEVGIPLVFAKSIQIKEIVQDFNRQRLLSYINNGATKYPGCTKIVKQSSGAEYLVSAFVENDHELNNGDVIYRDMVDGDIVFFNRQPSLKNTNMTALKIVVSRDPSSLTLRMNIIDTKFFNADFDGDQMNLIIPTSIEAQNEIGSLASADEWLLSYTTSSPEIGQVDDTIIGMFQLTRSNVGFDKFHAMLLFENTSNLPNLSGMETMSGREMLSYALAETPINFTRVPEFYKDHLAQYMKYDPNEIRVKIDQGRIVSGVLDKKSIGAGTNGGIYHIIANEYSSDKALEVMFNMQQMAIAYILQYGFSIGIKDVLLSKKAREEVILVASDLLNKSRIITDRLNSGKIVPPIGKTVGQFYEAQQIEALVVQDEFIEPIMSSINPESNNLFKLVMSGSKGKIEQVYNIMSAVGQKLINGARIPEKFGFKRSMPYFPRFCTEPGSRGYIHGSYATGLTKYEYIANAEASRFDLISKALSTSVTGEQNRKSIKNLESIVINHMRSSVKGFVIIQFAYGDNYADPRKVERVRFPTVLVSDVDFAAKFRHDKFPEFFATMKADRELYRECFLQVENMSVKELISDERRVPINIERIVGEYVREYTDVLAEPSGADLEKMVAMVDQLCANLCYLLTNDAQERAKSTLPEVMHRAVWLTAMSIRSYLHPKAIVSLRITPGVLERICLRVRDRYIHALINPGTAAGIIAAQSFSEPFTQYMLDAHTRSASGGTSSSGMNHAKEILAARPVERLEAPSVMIRVRPEYESNREKVQEIANGIEMMKLHQFVANLQIFFEKFGEAVHPKYVGENQMVATFMKMNPMLKAANMSRWCIRFAINKTSMILKNMNIELIVTRIRDLFPETFVVYSPDNSREVIMRVYLQNNIFRQTASLDAVRQIKKQMMDTTIRGIDGIINTVVAKMPRNRVTEDGSIKRKDDVFVINTTGTNMAKCLANPFVDALRTHSDAIREIEKVLGIEAARQKIITEMRNLVDTCNYAHYTVYSDEMTWPGRVTGIERSGLSARESSNMHLRIAFSSPYQTLEEAALNNAEDTIGGFSAPLLIGTVPRIGTLYSKIIVNENYVRENVKRASEYLDDL